MTTYRSSTRLRRAALVAVLAAITAAATGALPGRAEAYGYCGKVGGAKVYARAVKCVHARYWVGRERCPSGWRRRLVFAEFEPAVIGWLAASAGATSSPSRRDRRARRAGAVVGKLAYSRFRRG